MNTKTNERRFDIMFDGTTLNGADVSEVKGNLQQLFKLGDADIERMFCGQPISIKKNLDRKTATQYQQALSRAGAKIQLVLHQPDTAADNILPTAGEQGSDGTTAAAAPTQAGDLDVLPAGSDLLAASERNSAAPVDIATDHLQVEDPSTGGGRAVFDLGGTSGASADATAGGVGRYPAAGHIELDTALSVAELGAILEQDSTPAPTALVNVDHLQLVEPTDVTPAESEASQAPAAAAATAETDFSIAEAGSDLLQAHEKRQQVEADIDLSKISLHED